MARTRCTVCGKPALYRCKYCSDTLCKEHIPPEMHWCVGLEDYKRDIERRKTETKPNEKKQEQVETNIFSFFSHNYSYLLLLLISISFVLQLLFPGGLATSRTPNTYEELLWLYPPLVGERPWTLVTYIFIHGDFFHFLFNMFFLVFFAPVLERKVGSSKFLLIFFLAGIFAGIVYCLTSGNIPTVGASGALYGIFGALAVLMPRMKMYIFPFPFPLEMWMVVIMFAVLNFVMIGTAYPIAFTAHLAGLFFGLLAGMWLKKPS